LSALDEQFLGRGEEERRREWEREKVSLPLLSAVRLPVASS